MDTRQALHSSLTVEWFTPPDILEAARNVMGGIDLDPASCEAANQFVRATTYFDKDQDGLAHDWPGRVWLNPPYSKINGKSQAGLWVARLIEQFRAGITTEALVLVNNATAQGWFQPLWAFPICFPSYRIRFMDAAGTQQQSPTNGNAIGYLAYLGYREHCFIHYFGAHGPIVSRM